ncbi:hypothetical protein V8E52_005371 [Russula decolorans]
MCSTCVCPLVSHRPSSSSQAPLAVYNYRNALLHRHRLASGLAHHLRHLSPAARAIGKPLLYYGPYDKLLNYCFGDSFQYFVAPQSPPSDLGLRDTVVFVVFLVVFDANRHPVLIAEVKDDAWAHKADLRYSADDQIRRRYDAMLGDCPLPRLWGLSLLGTSLRVYCGTVATETIEPDFVPLSRPSPRRILPRDFLEGAWDIDILSPEGFNKMKEIITDVLAAAAAL